MANNDIRNLLNGIEELNYNFRHLNQAILCKEAHRYGLLSTDAYCEWLKYSAMCRYTDSKTKEMFKGENNENI